MADNIERRRIKRVIDDAGNMQEMFPETNADVVIFDPEAVSGGTNIKSTNVRDALAEVMKVAETGGVTGIKFPDRVDGAEGNTIEKGDVSVTKAKIGLSEIENIKYIPLSEKSKPNGVATLDGNGLVPSSQLPSYVDDVLEFPTFANFPATGETGKIYVDLDTNLTYRWSGTKYTEISKSLALGETSSTAFPGDRGVQAEKDIVQLEERATAVEQKNTEQDARLDKILDGTTPVDKANQLTNPRKISLNNGSSASDIYAAGVDFDGTKDISLSATLKDVATAGTYQIATFDSKGRMVGKGGRMIEYGAAGQTSPSDDLAVGGLFFEFIAQ